MNIAVRIIICSTNVLDKIHNLTRVINHMNLANGFDISKYKATYEVNNHNNVVNGITIFSTCTKVIEKLQW